MQKPLIFETTTAGKIPGTSFRTQTQDFLEVLATLQSGAQRPEGVKKDMVWRKVNADGSWEIYIAGDTVASDVEILNSEIYFSTVADVGAVPVAINDGAGDPSFDQTVLDAIGRKGVMRIDDGLILSVVKDESSLSSKTSLRLNTIETGSGRRVDFSDPDSGDFLFGIGTGGVNFGTASNSTWHYPTPRPQTAAGIGQFAGVFTDGVSYTLPSGGTWLHVIRNYTANGIGISSPYVGVSSGGTVFTVRSGYLGLSGWVWRIA